METRDVHLGWDIGDGCFARCTSGCQGRDIEPNKTVVVFAGVGGQSVHLTWMEMFHSSDFLCGGRYGEYVGKGGGRV